MIATQEATCRTCAGHIRVGDEVRICAESIKDVLTSPLTRLRHDGCPAPPKQYRRVKTVASGKATVPSRSERGIA